MSLISNNTYLYADDVILSIQLKPRILSDRGSGSHEQPALYDSYQRDPGGISQLPVDLNK